MNMGNQTRQYTRNTHCTTTKKENTASFIEDSHCKKHLNEIGYNILHTENLLKKDPAA